MGVTVFGCIAVLIMIFTLVIKIFPVTCRRSVKKASRLGGFAGTDLFQILFLFPLLTMFIEYTMSNSGENATRTVYDMECFLLNLLLLAGLCKMMILMMSNAKQIFRPDKATEITRQGFKVYVIFSTVFLQLLVFSSCIYSLSRRSAEAFSQGRLGVTDSIYFVVMTYTMVGYGDIVPGKTEAKILTAMISLAGFFASVYLIGAIASEFTGKNKN